MAGHNLITPTNVIQSDLQYTCIIVHCTCSELYVKWYVIGLPIYNFDTKIFTSKNMPSLMINDGVL